MEAKFGFQIRDSKPSDTGLREHSEVGAVNSLSSVEGQGSSVSRVGAMEHIFNETATLASKRQAKAIKASHGPRVSSQSKAEEKVMRTIEIQREVQGNRRCDRRVKN